MIDETKIKTSTPFINNRDMITKKIANFWDQISLGWHAVWGTHIHHGYYEDDQPIAPKEAQEKLIEKLAGLLGIASQDKILDIGCGMGGSSIYLAKYYRAHVVGITLSPKQVEIATHHVKHENLQNIFFKVEDALCLKSFEDNSFDIIWSLESCEQFFDKEKFIKEAYRVLKPNGKLMLATWCSNQEEYTGALARQYKKLCLAFDVPYMPTMLHYQKMLLKNNFTITETLDWSSYVKQSWDSGISLLNAFSFWKLLRISGWRGLIFSKQIKLMQAAFKQNRVKYGVFIARKQIQNH